MVSRNAAPLSAARASTKIGPGRWPASCVQKPALGLDEQPVVVDRALRRCGSAGTARTRAPGSTALQVAEAEAAVLDERFGPVDQRDVGIARAAREHLVAVVGGHELLVAVPRATPRDARRRWARYRVPTILHHGGAEVGEDHAGHAAGHAEAEVARADGDLDDRQARARQPGRRRLTGVTRPPPAA